MAVMEVTLPSGFSVDSDALPSLRNSPNVKRVETKEGDTVVMLYFDKVKTKNNPLIQTLPTPISPPQKLIIHFLFPIR